MIPGPVLLVAIGVAVAWWGGAAAIHGVRKLGHSIACHHRHDCRGTPSPVPVKDKDTQ